ncbi:MAG: protease modulator HflC [Eubacteriales bacterium]|nr:protease modulator HflC [Eubacteriales bacterium]
MKKSVGKTFAIVIVLVLLLSGFSCFHYNVQNREVLVFQFGKIVSIKDTPGVYLTIPFIQNTKSIFTGERLYDIPTTGVTTSDKKSMSANAYVTWKIVDTKKYYQTLNSVETAQSRIDTSVYSSIKNVISSTAQDDLITGKDGSLGTTILKRITSLASYGIEVTNVEIKVLDLPEDNKQSVYDRMISERNVIAAQYTAEGEKEANTIKAKAEADARSTKSNAEAEAAAIIADGETQYYSILAEAYSENADKTAFYKYWTELEALREAMANGGTIMVDPDNPLYKVLTQQTADALAAPSQSTQTHSTQPQTEQTQAEQTQENTQEAQTAGISE